MDGEDTVVVADGLNHRVVEWKRGATSGIVLAGGNDEVNRSDQLNRPTDVIFDKKTDSLIICEQVNRRVTRWSRRSGAESGVTIIDNVSCYGLAMDDEGSLYVTDVGKHEVRRYYKGEKSGIVVAGGYGKGAGLNQLNAPRHVCVDGEHSVYVSEEKNNRVVKWLKDAKEGILVAGGRGEGENLTQLNGPQGVRIDAAGNVYVADRGNQRVMRWCRGATQGTVVVGGNGGGREANQFNCPSGLFFDCHGHLYVADRANKRVQRFSIEKN